LPGCSRGAEKTDGLRGKAEPGKKRGLAYRREKRKERVLMLLGRGMRPHTSRNPSTG